MKIYLRNDKGFTLIELLVVVAIISLLSSIIFSSVNSVRAKAKDAAIKEEVSQLATVMAFNYDDYGSYCQFGNGWISANITCNSIFSGTYAAQATTICNNIYGNAAENNWGVPGGYKIYSYEPDCTKAYSFQVYLNDGKWYCSGSSGVRMEVQDILGLGC